eukprot:1144503-Pelagomonas_calceolata.AAC.4
MKKADWCHFLEFQLPLAASKQKQDNEFALNERPSVSSVLPCVTKSQEWRDKKLGSQATGCPIHSWTPVHTTPPSCACKQNVDNQSGATLSCRRRQVQLCNRFLSLALSSFLTFTKSADCAPVLTETYPCGEAYHT